MNRISPETLIQRQTRERNEGKSKKANEKSARARLGEFEEKLDPDKEFDPAEAMIAETLREKYDAEIARLMGVKEGEDPQNALSSIEYKIYQAHLNNKEAKIKTIIERLKTRAMEEGRSIDDFSRNDITEELGADYFEN